MRVRACVRAPPQPIGPPGSPSLRLLLLEQRPHLLAAITPVVSIPAPSIPMAPIPPACRPQVAVGLDPLIRLERAPEAVEGFVADVLVQAADAATDTQAVA